MFCKSCRIVIKPQESSVKCSDFFVRSQYGSRISSFCKITPFEMQYTYSEGVWKFWDLRVQLIAKTTYELQKSMVEMKRADSPIKKKLDS